MRKFFYAIGAASTLIYSPSTLANEWPIRPVQLIVPFPAGGTIDLVARRFAQSFSEEIKQSALVINRDGASGVIGTGAVATSEPNGYTIGFVPNGPLTVQPLLNRKLAYNINQFKPVCQVFSYPYVLAVPSNSPHQKLADFLVAAKRATIPTSYGFGGVGTAPHFTMLKLAHASNTKFLGVPFRGDPMVAAALKSKEIDAAFLTVEVAQRQGFKMLAVFSENRVGDIPNVLTAREQNVDVVSNTFVGLVVPSTTPAALTARLEKACANTVASASFQASMQQMGFPIEYLSSVSFDIALQHDINIKRRIVEINNLTLE